MKRTLLLIWIILVCLGCEKSSDLLAQEQTPISGPAEFKSSELLFSSGFESNTYISKPIGEFEINNWSNYEVIRGTDLETGFAWPIKILGANFGGIHKVDDHDGLAIENRIETLIGHTGEDTKALFQQINHDNGVTQTPYQINNISENPQELYISYWMKTDDTSLSGEYIWRAIWEYKTKQYGNKKNGFRMIAFMETDAEGKKHWAFQGDTSPQSPVWHIKNYDVPVILNEWFKVEYHIKWSESSDGYASMKVNDRLIAEHHGATTTKSDNLDFIILTQVYGNSYPMHQWVDDIEIWDGAPKTQ